MTISSDEKLQAAFDAGIISDAQMNAILAMDLSSKQIIDEEPFALIGGFGEILISIGLTIFLMGMLFFGSLAVFVVSIALSYYFVKIRKLTLPGIILIVFAFTAIWTLLISIIPTQSDVSPSLGSLFCAFVLTLMALYYYVFRLPFALLLIGISAVILEISLIATIYDVPRFEFSQSLKWLSIILSLFSGVIALLFALWYDRADLERITVNTQKAFWLHVFAAPLLLWPFMVSFFILQTPISGAVSVLGIFVLAILGLILDRRSFVTVGLASFGGLLLYFFNMDGLGVPFILLIIGAYALVIGTWWKDIRRRLFAFLPQENWQNFVPRAA